MQASPWVSNDGWTVSEQWVEMCKKIENGGCIATVASI